MQQIIQSQRDFFKTNTTKDINYRKQQLQKFENVLKANEQLMYDAIYKDFKKSEFETFTTELALIYNDIKEAKKSVKKWSRKRRKRTNLINQPGKSYVFAEPLGVSLIIGAWNYPYLLSFAPVISAMVAGCTIILKPSEVPTNTSSAIAKIVNENFEANYFKVVEGGIPETTALLNEKFDKIFFTGSTTVGKIVYQAAAKHLTPVTLELGGKCPAIISSDCNLKIVAKRLVWSKFINAGQTCLAPDYILVEKGFENELLSALKKEIENSNYNPKNNNFVQIIDQKNFDRLISLIDKDNIYFGGNYNIHERIIEPTILNNVSLEDKVMQEEIFGPILPVISYKNIEDTIAYIKSNPRPLSCYYFGKNAQLKNKVLTEISFGGGCINDAVMHISNSHFSFGGVGSSGIGSYHGIAGFRAFTHFKSILERPTWFELKLKYYPLTKKKMKMIKTLFRISS